MLAGVFGHNVGSIGIPLVLVCATFLNRRNYSHGAGFVCVLSRFEAGESGDDGAVDTEVLDRAADTIQIDGLAALHLEATLLHHAGRVVPDAVTQVAWT